MKEVKRVLIDVGHPAQVHQFKNLYKNLTSRGIDVLIVAKDKEMSEYLLKTYNINYLIIDKTKKGIISKLINLPRVYFRMYKIIKMFNPDILLSRFSFQSSHLAFLLNIPHIGFTDTEHVNFSDKLTVGFVDVKITANSYSKNLGKNHFRYNGNIELFYLHPDRFSPDITIKKELGLRTNEKYAIVRFVSWDAHHDIGEKGMSKEIKIELIRELDKKVKVFITSENDLPEEFKKYQIKIKPDRIHHALAFADVYVGEGGTMASEAACLGVPSIYINSLDAGVFQEEEEYGLLYSFRNLNGVIDKVKEIIQNPDCTSNHKLKLSKFLSNKIDVTSFIFWFIENYPNSKEIMRNNPDYQLKFK